MSLNKATKTLRCAGRCSDLPSSGEGKLNMLQSQMEPLDVTVSSSAKLNISRHIFKVTQMLNNCVKVELLQSF